MRIRSDSGIDSAAMTADDPARSASKYNFSNLYTWAASGFVPQPAGNNKIANGAHNQQYDLFMIVIPQLMQPPAFQGQSIQWAS